MDEKQQQIVLDRIRMCTYVHPTIQRPRKHLFMYSAEELGHKLITSAKYFTYAHSFPIIIEQSRQMVWEFRIQMLKRIIGKCM